MGTIPTDVNNTANTIDKIIQDAIFDVAITAFKTYAQAQIPFLGWPLISSIFSGLLSMFGSYIYTALSQVATFTVIDTQVVAEQENYGAALTQLQAAQVTGDPNALARALQAYKQALASLIHYDGSSTV